jgi:hypothetical protein
VLLPGSHGELLREGWVPEWSQGGTGWRLR